MFYLPQTNKKTLPKGIFKMQFFSMSLNIYDFSFSIIITTSVFFTRKIVQQSLLPAQQSLFLVQQSLLPAQQSLLSTQQSLLPAQQIPDLFYKRIYKRRERWFKR